MTQHPTVGQSEPATEHLPYVPRTVAYGEDTTTDFVKKGFRL